MGALSFDAALAAVHKFDPQEARDDHGRWTAGAAASAAITNPERFFSAKGKLTKPEDRAVGDYTGSLYGNINRYLRGTLNTDGVKMDEVHSSIAGLDSAIQKHTATKEFVVYRGGKDWETVGWGGTRAPSVGGKMTFKAFLSTSLDQGRAEHFSLGYDDPMSGHMIDTTYHILVPKGAHAMPVDNGTDDGGEREVILPRGSSFEVQKIDTGKHEVWLRMAP